MRTNNKLNPHMTPSPGIKPGPHWWEASALTTAPSLLPLVKATALYCGTVYYAIPDNSVNEIIQCLCNYSNQSYPVVLSCGTVYYAIPDNSVNEIIQCLCNHSNQSYPVVLSRGTVYYSIPGVTVNKILQCDHSNQSYLKQPRNDAWDFSLTFIFSGCFWEIGRVKINVSHVHQKNGFFRYLLGFF